MKRILGRLTYANTMATIAVFIALGGASYAAVRLPKNSVGSRQIKNNAITAAKIKNGAVGGAKIDPSRIGTVPSASHATSADQATNATHADVAGRVETLPGPEAVHQVANFEPGCSSNGQEFLGPVGFYKDGFGEVHLVGSVFCGTEGADAFVLPPGFRPSTEILQPTLGSKAGAEVIVLPSGVVRPFGSTSATLFGVSFRTN
jgi:hypothetical protein